MTPMANTFFLILIVAILLVESANDISHLHRKLAAVKRKQGLEDDEDATDTHKAIYPIRHHALNHVDVLPLISDYHSVNKERSIMNMHGGVAHLQGGRR
ncbi:hypothetical protein V3C99_000013 [Haemonchus contortus]|uniref:Secreted RxLR effector peptide protein n=1 Tax=Haemonchus contortus TaxID=6289 RepID=A0A7I4YGD4_HAECO